MSLLSSILNSLTLISSLTSTLQDGGSLLGTLLNVPLPPFLNCSLTDFNVSTYGVPWGTANALSPNPYIDPPYSGNTVFYDFTLERGIIAPDGFNRSVILVNGQFPGPLLSANWGDTISVTVHNKITGPEEGTSLHYHGFLQKGTEYYDGVPSVGQCPIAPGSSFTYTFQADLYGTSWYHSHYSAQYAGGAAGPMVIYGPKTQPYDIDLGPVFINDYYHADYFSLVEKTMSPVAQGANPPLVFSDNNLINGKMDVDCKTVVTNGAACVPNAGLSKFRFKAGKIHRLRLINAGSEAIQRFSIDGHTMTVIANDFVPIKPYKTKVVTLGIGQRTDVLVTGTMTPTSAVWMRSNISALCSLNDGNPNALAAIYYGQANTSLAPKSKAWPYTETSCSNDPLASTVPLVAWQPPAKVATVKTVNITFAQNKTGNYLWKMNGQTFRADYNDPVLLLAGEGNTSYPYDPEWNVYNFGTNTSIRLVVYNFVPAAHPMHLHGHNFWILAEGQGFWDGHVVNPTNPQRRDVQLLRPADSNNPSTKPGYIVIEFNADNPGVWPFHCHIAWHVSAGLYINVMERPDKIAFNPNIAAVMPQTCIPWMAYTNRNKPDQIDSGL